MKILHSPIAIHIMYWLTTLLIIGSVGLFIFVFSNTISMFAYHDISYIQTSKFTVITINILALLVCLTLIVALSYFWKFIRNIKLNAVFTSKNIRILKQLAIVLIVFNLLSVSQKTWSYLSLPHFSDSSFDPHIGFAIFFHLSLFFIALFFWLLKGIFSTGFSLQTENDLTV